MRLQRINGSIVDFQYFPGAFATATHFDEVYQLAADMGGAGFVFTGDNDADILRNSSLIHQNVLGQAGVVGCGKMFFSSSACVYPEGVAGREEDAIPANPPSEYGWEKLFAERLYQAYNKNYGVDVRIARFQNTYGPYGTYKGGREKAPAAICRKVAETKDGIVECWGDGEQVRPFVYIDDLLDGIESLMESDVVVPVNLGPTDSITINGLFKLVGEIADKEIEIKHIDGPTGEKERKCDPSFAKMALGWEAKTPLKDGLTKTYNWIKEQL